MESTLVRISLTTIHHEFFYGHLISNDLHNLVFGSVTEGLDVVKAVEAVGSGSGRTKSPVIVASSGQL